MWLYKFTGRPLQRTVGGGYLPLETGSVFVLFAAIGFPLQADNRHTARNYR
jgi:hypothetical protein